jgi:catechol 2,3-dioxygenase-like lactoylglutathione lyase family enzyme
MRIQNESAGLRIWLLAGALLATHWLDVAQAGLAVDSVGITVGDIETSVAFYSDVLAFEPVARWEVSGEEYEHLFGVFGLRLDIVRMQLGEEFIELMEFLAPQGRPIPVDSRSNDLWFQHIAIIVKDMDRAYRRLREHGVTFASSGPQTLPDWNVNAGGISAFYFRDPDGNHLEILEFPVDKGHSKWHEPTDRLFLGIDHTAIVVSNTQASLGFYRDTLGLSVGGTSENYGPEQERLNNVFGARLLITALRPDRGPGIEFLEYLAPRTGRPMPVDSQSNDQWHWQVNLRVDNVSGLDENIRHRGYRYVSSGIVAVAASHGKQVLMVRDPDGHALELEQEQPQ